MRRREFITLLGGAAAWPVVARSQPNVRRVGVLMGGSQGDGAGDAGLTAFTTALREIGWTSGRNIQIDVRWGAADVDRMQELAKELVGLQPDVILGHTTQVVAALQRETKTIPVVFVVVSDPVGSGFVDGLPRPGGNITGFVNIESSLASKWIELLKDIAPRATRAALMFNPQTAPYFSYYLQPFEDAARSRGLEPIAASVQTDAEIESVIAGLSNEPTAGLAIMADTFLSTRHNIDLIVALAARHRVPTIYPYRFMVTAGGLASYGVDGPDLFRRAAAYVDRILKGGRPADLPVQLPTRFELAVNLKTAKALGLTIPSTLLARADEVIE